MSAQTKRMQLSRDQRAVLEAVYAIEKLPDASLRERLGSYLSLTTRQIQVSAASPGQAGSSQDRGTLRSRLAPHPLGSGWALLCSARVVVRRSVPARQRGSDARSLSSPSSYPNQVWFQNRRQRSKTTQPDGKLEEDPAAAGGKKASVLNTSDQILEALFEFGGPGAQGGGVSGAGPSGLLPPGTDHPASLLDCESFDWALPGASSGRNGASTSLAGLKRTGSDRFLAAQAVGQTPCGLPDACPPLTLPKPAALSAILGFVCNVLGADACDYFRVESGEPALAQFFLPAGQRKVRVRAMVRVRVRVRVG